VSTLNRGTAALNTAKGGATSPNPQEYWDDVVVAPGARRVIPVHCDHVRTSLDESLRPLPRGRRP
jgi:hypothetical protein